jgi:hypothetical protein
MTRQQLYVREYSSPTEYNYRRSLTVPAATTPELELSTTTTANDRLVTGRIHNSTLHAGRTLTNEKRNRHELENVRTTTRQTVRDELLPSLQLTNTATSISSLRLSLD